MIKPVVLTCGEPAGIGPEVAWKAWRDLRALVPMMWLGDPHHLPAECAHEIVGTPEDAIKVCHRAMPVLHHPFAADVTLGRPNPDTAQDVIDVIARAVGLVQEGLCSAIVTAPIQKQVLKEGAGFAHPGHTEFLAHLAGGADVVMMLASEQLRVVPATIHIALQDVPTTLSPDLLRRCIEVTHQGLQRQFGIPAPRIAVAGLNPHAGEGGTMGRQEVDWLAKLIADMIDEGYTLSGPLPADTMFHASARARYDAAVCMYHDQALIPIKTLDFDRGVNVTLGLPFIRTSPDHGTALDIAGRDIANPQSMIEAIRMAHRMTQKT